MVLLVQTLPLSYLLEGLDKMASSPYKTLGNIVSAVCRDFKEATNSIIVGQIQRWSNEAVENWALRRKRDFLNKTFHIQLEAQVSSSYNISSGSVTVIKTGSATLPLGSANDHKFKNQGFQEVYDVASFTSTTITLASPYKGASNTAASGVFFQSSVFIDESIRSIYRVYHDYFTWPVEQKGAEDFRQAVQVTPDRTDYCSIWTMYGMDLNSGSDQRRMSVFPFPKLNYTLHVDANLYVPQLSNLTDEPPIPLQHRQLIYWYNMAKMAAYHGDDNAEAKYENNYNVWLNKIDAEFAPEEQYPQIQTDKDRWISRTQRGRPKLRFT